MILNKKMLTDAIKHAKRAMAEIDKINQILLPANDEGCWLEARRFAIYTNILNDIAAVSGEEITRDPDGIVPYKLEMDGVPFEAFYTREQFMGVKE